MRDPLIFSGDAMACTFFLRMVHEDPEIAEDAAGACFLLLEELEAELSCFRLTSDVSRINALQTHESVLISETTHACLLQAMEAQAETAGLFDATLGLREGPARGQLEIASERPLVVCHDAGRKIDLGGIGKGFALERLAEVLGGYHISSALLSAGASTMLAMGSQAWPISLGDADPVTIQLQNMTLSASGTEIQGAHVVHPDIMGEPEYPFSRVWVLHPSAAMADAFSTACLLMDETDLRAFHESQDGTVRIFAERNDGRVWEVE